MKSEEIFLNCVLPSNGSKLSQCDAKIKKCCNGYTCVSSYLRNNENNSRCVLSHLQNNFKLNLISSESQRETESNRFYILSIIIIFLCLFSNIFGLIRYIRLKRNYTVV